MIKTVSILGSTGTIGIKAINFILQHKNEFEVIGLTAGNNIDVIIEQAKLLKPKYLALRDEQGISRIKNELAGLNIECYFGENGIIEVASKKADVTLAAISGFNGLIPTLAAIRAGNNIALANKESLVCAGKIFLDEAKKYNSTIIPVDSEHSAIFQIFYPDKVHLVKHIYLTCSGGPFRTYTTDDLAHVKVSDALKHPRWEMGKKITIDSATLVNKALEKIEACHLFALPKEQVKIIIHPEAIIHGMVTYIDGSMVAQLSNTDMIIPISYAFSWPSRLENGQTEVDFEKISSLNFSPPDHKNFPSLGLVEQVIDEMETASVIFNAANEVAVDAFLLEKIKFGDIVSLIEESLHNVPRHFINSIEDVVELDAVARRYCQNIIEVRKC